LWKWLMIGDDIGLCGWIIWDHMGLYGIIWDYMGLWRFYRQETMITIIASNYYDNHKWLGFIKYNYGHLTVIKQKRRLRSIDMCFMDFSSFGDRSKLCVLP
jgi:hypothetical protein